MCQNDKIPYLSMKGRQDTSQWGQQIISLCKLAKCEWK